MVGDSAADLCNENEGGSVEAGASADASSEKTKEVEESHHYVMSTSLLSYMLKPPSFTKTY